VAFAASASDWEKTVAAAKQEGKVTILGPAGADIRDAFIQGFQKKYPEIQVDFSGMSGAQVAPKLLNELGAGLYRTDLVVSGTTTAIGSLIPANAVVPMQPFMIGPDSGDASKWMKEKSNSQITPENTIWSTATAFKSRSSTTATWCPRARSGRGKISSIPSGKAGSPCATRAGQEPLLAGQHIGTLRIRWDWARTS
jgi:hypothetical protein